MGAACWSLLSFKRVTKGAGTMLAYWLSVANDGPRLEVLEATMKKHFEQAIGSRGTHVLVLLSLLAFVSGMCTGWMGD